MTRPKPDPLDTKTLQTLLRARLHASAPNENGPYNFPGVTPEQLPKLQALIPSQLTHAAVLVPIMDRHDGLTVLLTERSAQLRNHAGQISFPGGRSEPSDSDLRMTALREAYEEVGLPMAQVEVLGYMPAHCTLTGFCVTPVVGWVQPHFEPRLDTREVASIFEVPLSYLLDPSNHQLHERQFHELTLSVYDIHHGERRIWGATAAILIELYRLLTVES